MKKSADKRAMDSKTIVEKESQKAEAEGLLKKAKAVLSGADFSFMQTWAETQRLGFLAKNVQEQAQCPEDESRRMALFQSLTALMKDANDACVEMCKNTGAYPNCACPRFEPPDSTPGVVTWDELYDIFDSLKDQGREMLKKYHKISA